MRCRRICRELLWLARFGEFGPSSQPHLDHLATCRGCRDEVGFDRAMVEQLRIALAARIENANPPSTAWEGILARAQRPEPRPAARLWEWSTGLLARLRFATAMAGTGLALIVALNMQIVPGALPANDAGSGETESTALEQVPRIPPTRNSLAALAREWGDSGASDSSRPDPEAVLTAVGRFQLPSSPTETSPEPPAETSTTLRLVVRPMQTPDPGAADARIVTETEGTAPASVGSEPGEPS